MSKILVLGLAAVLTAGGAVCVAQATAGARANGSAAVSGRRVATGNSINAALQGSVDSKKARVGDPVQAVTRETATLPDGMVLPKGSTLMGHVTQATAGGRSEGDGALGFAFDQVKTRGGRTMPVRLTLLGVAPPVQVQGFADDDTETMAGPVGAGTSVRGAGGAPRAGGAGW